MYTTAQTTIASAIKVKGKGIHLGSENLLRLQPAEPNSGLMFSYKGQTAKYLYPQVRGGPRGTNITIGEHQLSTIEHLISALVGCGVDNCLIEVEGDEIPITDGSARLFTDQITMAGIKKFKESKKFITLKDPVILADGERSLVAVPGKEFAVTFVYDHPLLDPQITHFNLFTDNYPEQIAPARTFGFAQEIEQLQQSGYIKGADLSNALLIKDKAVSAVPRFADEICRHKILDLIGDIYAAGSLPLAHIYAVRSGHSFNSKLVEELISRI